VADDGALLVDTGDGVATRVVSMAALEGRGEERDAARP
jgi:hypothetical protein